MMHQPIRKIFGFGLATFMAFVIVVVKTSEDGGEILRAGVSSVFPSQKTMDAWASELDLKFKQLTDGVTDITGASQLEYKYQKTVSENDAFEIVHADGEKILLEITDKIAKIFDKNIAALKNLQEGAERLIETYTYDNDLSLDKVSYTNVNDLKNISEQMVYSKHFKQDIYDKSSGVQIPLEIYEGYNSNQMSRICPDCTSVCDLCANGLFWRRDSQYGLEDVNIVKNPEILNGINWSGGMEEIFQRNRQEFPGIYWQSFGSREGYLRVYPAARWPVVDGLPDLFDVRRRPWYIHGISSPKDVIILLDTSGSMHGQSFDIMKLAAKTLLNTLGENDYVNVARFARNVTWVTPCLTTLVQANARNKRLLFDGIDSLTDHHVASYSKALEFAYTAFEDFEETRETNEGANCHKLIMVFSDGGTEYPGKIIKVFTNSSRAITRYTRIFSYAVGPHPLPTVALKKMACDTGGAFTTITSMGAIRTKIQDYVRVLSKPLVLNQAEDFLRTSFKKDHLGLGFMTTITLPVFNVSAHSNNQTLAGIVGVDIPVYTFSSLAPRSKLGPFGYSFGINTNGYAIWHPDLWTVANYLEDPAHNEFTDMEGETSEMIALREDLVNLAYDRGEGHKVKVLNVPIMMQDGHATVVQKEYHYGSVRGTTFAVGVVVPKNWDHIRVPVQLNAEKELQMINQIGSVLAPWKFCDETKEDPDSEAETIEDIIKLIQVAKCRGEDLNHLVWDAANVREVFEGLKPLANDPELISRFVTTDGGLTMVKPTTKTSNELESLNADPYNSTLYRFVVSSPTPVLFVQKFVSKEVIPLYHVESFKDNDGDTDDSLEVTDDEDEEEPRVGAVTSHHEKKTKNKSQQQPTIVMKSPKETAIHLAKAFRVSKNGKNFTAGVAGVRVTESYIQRLVLDQTGSPYGELSCRNSSDIRCYFIDLSGYILASNQPKTEIATGDFLGHVDEQIMDHLVKNNFFNELPEYNYQALCPSPIECTTASSSILRSVFGSILSSIAMAVKSVFGLIQQLNYTVLSILASLYLPMEPVEAVSEYGYKIPDGLHRCTTKTSNWYLNEDSPVVYRDRMNNDCGGNQCARNFHLYRLKNINGIFIVADDKCNFCKGKRFFDGPVEVDTGEDCLLPRLYRKRPEECFSSHENEIFECSSASSFGGSTLLKSLFILITLRFLLH